MKVRIQYGVSLIALTSALVCIADASTPVVPYLSFRSQSENAARACVGVTNHMHTSFPATRVAKPTVVAAVDVASKNSAVEVVSASGSSDGRQYGCFSLTPEYTRSFDNDAISKNLFGCYYLHNCCSLNLTGSDVVGRGATDLMADWFYLPGDYKGTISFAPRIQNASVDFSFYWGMDDWAKGLYFRMHAPLTWTKWDLNATFRTTEPGTLVSGGSTYLDSAEKFFCKKGVMTTTGITTIHPLTSARFCGCACDENKVKTRLADIQADLGWDFFRRENGHVGLFVRGVAPTGNRPNGRWLFEPIVGNGHHWELGGGLTSSVIFWRNEEKDTQCGFSVDANVTHLFRALQHRVFDLKGLPLSRYMTAYKSNLPEVAPLANLTATTINSSIAVQADVVAMFNCTWGNWTGDVGYNFWATTREVLTCSTWSNNCFGKGSIKNAVFLSDNIEDNWTFDSGSNIHQYLPPITYNPVLTDDDIDYDSARTKGMSHKVFGHVGYSWMEREIVPFIGVGGEAEFGRNSECKDSCGSTCSSVCSSGHGVYASLTQWGVWLKGGVSF